MYKMAAQWYTTPQISIQKENTFISSTLNHMLGPPNLQVTITITKQAFIGCLTKKQSISPWFHEVALLQVGQEVVVRFVPLVMFGFCAFRANYFEALNTFLNALLFKAVLGWVHPLISSNETFGKATWKIFTRHLLHPPGHFFLCHSSE